MKKTIALLTLLLSCSTSGKKDEIQIAEKIFKLADIPRSVEPFGNSVTYDLTFTLIERRKNIFLKVIAVSPLSEDRYRNLSTYFSLDRGILRLDRDNNVSELVFSEIYRNFDTNWNILPDKEIVENEDDPLFRFIPGRYRIRFVVTDPSTEKIIVVMNNDIKVAFSNQ